MHFLIIENGKLPIFLSVYLSFHKFLVQNLPPYRSSCRQHNAAFHLPSLNNHPDFSSPCLQVSSYSFNHRSRGRLILKFFIVSPLTLLSGAGNVSFFLGVFPTELKIYKKRSSAPPKHVKLNRTGWSEWLLKDWAGVGTTKNERKKLMNFWVAPVRHCP